MFGWLSKLLIGAGAYGKGVYDRLNKGGSVRRMNKGGAVNSRAIAKKYFKGGLV